MPAISRPSVAFERTFRHGSRRSIWCMYATRPMRCALGSPLRVTDPVSGWVSPATMFRRVLLPHPLGPTMTTNSPSWTLREMSSMAWTGGRSGLGNDLAAFRMEIAGVNGSMDGQDFWV